MKDTIGRQFYFFFPNWDSFIYLSSLTAVTRTSKTTLNKSGRSCLFPDLRGNSLSFSPLRMIFAAGLWNLVFIMLIWGFPDGSEGKASACNAGDLGSIPGSGRSPGEGNGNLLQYPCLENLMDRGAWWAAVHRVTKSRTRLSD